MDSIVIAIVTGASRGIGKAIASILAKKGYMVVGTATTEKGANDISSWLQGEYNKGVGLCLDVGDKKQIDSFIDKVNKDFGAPSILVNNAGITRDNLLIRMKDAEWDDVISVNLSSVFYLSRACIRGMVKAKFGRIVNISSVVASMGNIGQANYCSAKSGLEGLTRSMAKEFGSKQVTVNCVAPGFIETDMTKDLNSEHIQKIERSIALRRIGKSEDIAFAVDFLISSDYITGNILHVNGGLYM